jgi:mannitol-1-phosphate/altronate dehydrogenase
LAILFAQAFCFLERKKKQNKTKQKQKHKNKSINKQLKNTKHSKLLSPFMSDQNIFSTKKQKAPSKKFCQVNPTFLHKFP